MNNFTMRKKNRKKIIFVISVHTSALRCFRFKPSKTQEKKCISSSFALCLLREENKGIAEGENFANEFVSFVSLI